MVCSGSMGGMMFPKLNSELKNKIQVFSYCPLLFMDDTWLKPLELSEVMKNLPNWRLNPNLNSAIVEKFEIVESTSQYEDLNISDLDALNKVEYIRLLTFIGVLLHYPAIKLLILKRDRAIIQDFVGQDWLHFCIHGAPILFSAWPDNWLQELPDLSEIDVEHFITVGLHFIMPLYVLLKKNQLCKTFMQLPYAFYNTVNHDIDIDKSELIMRYQLIKKIAKRMNLECFHLLK